jgi:hypothetical protein
MASSVLKQTELEFTNSNSATGAISFDTNNKIQVNRTLQSSGGIVASSFAVSGDSNYVASTDFDDITAGDLKFKDDSGNVITVTAPASVTAHTLTLPSAQGSSNSVVSNNGSGALTWGYISTLLPKRWEFGRRRFKWKIGMSTTGFTLGGDAYNSTQASNYYVGLTTATNGQQGRFYYDFGSAPSIGDWEMRAQIKSGSGADGFLFFANSSVANSSMSVGSASNGYQAFINEYGPNGYFIKLYDGSSTITTQTGKTTDLNNGYPQLISFRKIGTTLTIELLDYQGSYSASFQFEGTTTSSADARYWGIAAFTGASNTAHEMHSMELRDYDRSTDLSSEIA